jgi:hypothetical protein
MLPIFSYLPLYASVPAFPIQIYRYLYLLIFNIIYIYIYMYIFQNLSRIKKIKYSYRLGNAMF